ncbi:hypothetical protein Aduo_018818 [Ancylostoma duodenale]
MTQWKDPMVHNDEMGTVVIILPLEPPKFEFDWIVGFVQYVYKWLEYVKRNVLFPGPRGQDAVGWETVRRDGYHTITDVLNEKPACRHLIQHFLPVAATFSGTESCLALETFKLEKELTFTEAQCRTILAAWQRDLGGDALLPGLKSPQVRQMKRPCKRPTDSDQEYGLPPLEGPTSLPKRPYIPETVTRPHGQDPRNRRRARKRAEARLAARLQTSSETE